MGILAFMASLEVYRVNKLKDPSYVPGDLSLGQGPGRWNPFGFDYTPEEYAEKQLQVVGRGRRRRPRHARRRQARVRDEGRLLLPGGHLNAADEIQLCPVLILTLI